MLFLIAINSWRLQAILAITCIKLSSISGFIFSMPNFMARFALACIISMYHQHVPSACISMYHQHYHQHVSSALSSACIISNIFLGIISDAIVLSPFSLCFWIAFHNLLLKHSFKITAHCNLVGISHTLWTRIAIFLFILSFWVFTKRFNEEHYFLSNNPSVSTSFFYSSSITLRKFLEKKELRGV